MIASISPERALRFSGRFIVTTSVWPTCSTKACGSGIGTLLRSGPERTVISMPVGQIVGSMSSVRPVAAVMADLVTGFEDTVARLDKLRSA
ncbi:hypothetical protein [Nocardioides caldifontis]|uniref:hypothetical protein n=1 Tax=Nocardioides caldifontis TaxID=2588938 RepID=UPI00193A8286|nr:hypothetical protein [Nocardioides caldifontis]